MPSIATSVFIGVPPTVAWDALADLASHAEWMRDVASLEFETDTTSGVGTRMRVDTRVGPLRTTDLLEVTEWIDGQLIEVGHHGLIRGQGVFELAPEGSGTRLTWRERLVFPTWLGGPVAAALAKPILVRIWRGNLARLKASLEERM